jgi:hypothetical protein
VRQFPLVEMGTESIEDLGRIQRAAVLAPQGAPQAPSGSTRARSWVVSRAAPEHPPFNFIEGGCKGDPNHARCRYNPEKTPVVPSGRDTLGLKPTGEGALAEPVGVAPPGRLTAS